MPGREELVLSLVREWLGKAEEDYAVAERLLGLDPQYVDAICFHAQQAAEKWIKAALTQSQVLFPKTHDLVQLVLLLRSIHKEAADSLPGIAQLTPYGVECRYPGELPQLTPQDARQAVELARHTRNVILPLLKAGGC